jgi:hypothetical protein
MITVYTNHLPTSIFEEFKDFETKPLITLPCSISFHIDWQDQGLSETSDCQGTEFYY